MHVLVWDKLVKAQFAFLLVPLSAPRNLRVSDEWYNRLRISWDAPPSPTMGYRIVYKPINSEFLNWFFFWPFVFDYIMSWNHLLLNFVLKSNSCSYSLESAINLGVSHFKYESFIVTEWCRLEGITGEHLVQVPDQNRASLEQVSLTLSSWVCNISKDGDFLTSLSICSSFWLPSWWNCLS